MLYKCTYCTDTITVGNLKLYTVDGTSGFFKHYSDFVISISTLICFRFNFTMIFFFNILAESSFLQEIMRPDSLTPNRLTPSL